MKLSQLQLRKLIKEAVVESQRGPRGYTLIPGSTKGGRHMLNGNHYKLWYPGNYRRTYVVDATGSLSGPRCLDPDGNLMEGIGRHWVRNDTGEPGDAGEEFPWVLEYSDGDESAFRTEGALHDFIHEKTIGRKKISRAKEKPQADMSGRRS